MVEELRIVRWCDVCDAGRRAEAVSRWQLIARTYTTMGQTPALRVLDTCATHESAVKAAVDLCAIARPDPRAASGPGQKSERAPRPDHRPDIAPGQLRCPHCPSILSVAGMVKHLQRLHGAAVSQPKACPDCGLKLGGSAVSMIRHRRAAHAYDYLAAMAASVEEGSS